MGVEQEGLGLWIFEPRILPSRRAAASSSGIRAARMNGRAPSAGGRQALRRRSRRHGTGRSAAGTRSQAARTLAGRLVDEQQHRRDEGRQAARQFGGALRASRSAGSCAYSTKPTASAPAATAASTSCSRVRPQILMRVRWAASGLSAFMATNHTQPCGWAGSMRRRRPGPGNTGRRAKRWARPRRGRAPPAPGSSIAAAAGPGRSPAGSP